VFNDSTLTATSKQMSGLLNNTKYFWRVNAKNAAGTSGYSTVWNFTTIVALPAIVILSSPANNSDNVSTRPIFQWRRVPDAAKYQFELARDASFQNIVIIDTMITDTVKNFNTDLLYKTRYYWRVKAVNAAGSGNYSVVFNFTTVKQPVAAPSNLNSVWLPNGRVRLTWNDNSVNEAGFIIKRKSGDSLSVSQFASIDTVNAGIVDYFDTTASQITLYTYMITAYTIDSMYANSNMTVIQTATGINGELPGIPSEFILYQNYPNPFNPSTIIRFGIPKASEVKIELYSSQGDLLRVLESSERQPGYFEVSLDMHSAASGVYFCRIIAIPNDRSDAFINIKKILLVK